MLRNKFSTLESQDVDTPAELSFFALSARLSRTDAAKLFYQILGARRRACARRQLRARILPLSWGAGVACGVSSASPLLVLFHAVTRSHSFISAEQSEAYGDITLGRGPYL